MARVDRFSEQKLGEIAKVKASKLKRRKVKRARNKARKGS